MISKTGMRCLAVCLLPLMSACVNTPSGYWPAPLFDHASLVTADPAALKFAAQSNVKPRAYTLEWKVTREPDDSVLAKSSIVLERLAAGRKVGFGLPVARDGQAWSVWGIHNRDRERLLSLREKVRAAKARDEKLVISIEWASAPADGAAMPDVVYMTYAVRLADDETWFTLMDNLAVIPDDATNGSRAD